MSRAARTLRGAAGAISATLIAALSHGLGGEEVTILALAATAILALPLCVALAGRIGSLWRLALAVGCSQFLFHWSFAGIGAGSSSAAGAESSAGIPPGSHAAHLAALRAFTPENVPAGALDVAMWVSHALAAILTVALLHRGERAFLAVLRLVSRALPLARPCASLVPSLPRLPLAGAGARPRARLIVGAGISYRGPPLRSFSAS